MKPLQLRHSAMPARWTTLAFLAMAACGSDQNFTSPVGTFDSLDSILGQDPLLAIVGRYVDGEDYTETYVLDIIDLNGDLVPEGIQYPQYPAFLVNGSSYPVGADNLYVFENRYVVLAGVRLSSEGNTNVLETFDLNTWDWLEPLALNLSEDERVLGLSPHTDALYMVTAQPVADLGWIESDNPYTYFKRYDYDMRVYAVNLLDQDLRELSVVRMRGVEALAAASASKGSLYALFQSRDPYIGLIHKGDEIGEDNDTYFFNANHPEDEWQFQSVIVGGYAGQFDYYYPDDGSYAADNGAEPPYYVCGGLTIYGEPDSGNVADIDPLVGTGSTCMTYKEESEDNGCSIANVSLYAADSSMSIGHMTAQDGSTVEIPNEGEAALIWKSTEENQ